jgi:hypothetical protein
MYTSPGAKVLELLPYPSFDEFIATLALATGTAGAGATGVEGAVGTAAPSPAQAELSSAAAARVMMRVDREKFAIDIDSLGMRKFLKHRERSAVPTCSDCLPPCAIGVIGPVKV